MVQQALQLLMRKAKPPRLWFREDDEIWIILDRGRQIRTGCSRDDIDGAAKALETYIGGRHTTDGFNEAYYGRPEMLLASEARRACSAWSFVGDDIISRFESELGSDLKSGRWDQRHGRLRTQPVFEGSLKLIVGRV
jgi:hypothetical protein